MTDRQHVKVPYEMYEDARLRPEIDVWLFGWIVSQGGAEWNLDALAKSRGMEPRTLDAALARLVDAGYASIIKTDTDGAQP